MRDASHGSTTETSDVSLPLLETKESGMNLIPAKEQAYSLVLLTLLLLITQQQVVAGSLM